MTKIIEKLSLEGKISQVHAEEIEEIIQGELSKRYTKGLDVGLMNGKRIWKQHINEGIKKIEDKYEKNSDPKFASTEQCIEALVVLDKVKRINK